MTHLSEPTAGETVAPGPDAGPDAGVGPRGGQGRRPGRWRTLLVVLPLLAGLAVTGLVGQRLLWAQVDPADAAWVTCWDGGSAPRASACTLPTGVAGLRHVYPAFTPARSDCVDELARHPAYRRPTMWTCRVPLGPGRVGLVTFSEVDEVERTATTLTRAYGERGRRHEGYAGTPDRLLWRAAEPDADGRWALAALMTDYPYLAEVRAPGPEAASRLMDRFASPRPAASLAVLGAQ